MKSNSKLANLFAPAFLILALLPQNGRAAEKAFSPTAIVGGKSLALHGDGTRKATLFAIKVYQAAFYASKNLPTLAEALADSGAKRIEIRYLRDFSLEDTVKAWKFQFEESSGVKPDQLETEMALLASFQKAIREGDTQTFDLVAGNTIFLINGKPQGEIAGTPFQHALLTVFLGPNPPTKELRTGLLRGLAVEKTP